MHTLQLHADLRLACCSNADVEEQIGHLRAELLHKEQETQRVQLQLAKEVEERERAERKVGLLSMQSCMAHTSELEHRLSSLAEACNCSCIVPTEQSGQTSELQHRQLCCMHSSILSVPRCCCLLCSLLSFLVCTTWHSVLHRGAGAGPESLHHDGEQGARRRGRPQGRAPQQAPDLGHGRSR